MNPVVLIATHQRIQITTINIQLLLAQSIVPHVVLVVSDKKEHEQYNNIFGNRITIVRASNTPLGAKWQAGVNTAQKLNPDPLIILGSDDILCVDFIKNMTNQMRQFDFVGLQRWYILFGERLYLFDYMVPNFPLGGGRAYSLKLLKQMKFRVFDTSRSRLLDDQGWTYAKKSGMKFKLIRDTEKAGLEILSVKGDWPVMNDVRKMFGHPNTKCIGAHLDPEILKTKFNYVWSSRFDKHTWECDS